MRAFKEMSMLPSLLIAFFLLPFKYPTLAAPEMFWEHSWEQITQALSQRRQALRYLPSYFKANSSNCAGLGSKLSGLQPMSYNLCSALC